MPGGDPEACPQHDGQLVGERGFAGGRSVDGNPRQVCDCDGPDCIGQAARKSPNPNDFALVALLGLLGLRIFDACGSNIADLGEEHGHRVLRVRGKGGKVVLVPLPPAVARAIDQAVDERTGGPILRNTHGRRMDQHAATRRLKHLAQAAGIRMPRMHPHMLRHTFVTTMLDAGVSIRDVQIAARHADPRRRTMRYDRARKSLDRHPNCILAAYMASGTYIAGGTHSFAESSAPTFRILRADSCLPSTPA